MVSYEASFTLDAWIKVTGISYENRSEVLELIRTGNLRMALLDRDNEPVGEVSADSMIVPGDEEVELIRSSPPERYYASPYSR